MRRRPVPALKKTIALLKKGVDKQDEAVCKDAFKVLERSECLLVRTKEATQRDCARIAPPRSQAFVKEELVVGLATAALEIAMGAVSL
eukprot:scaffold5314_cov64-Phaeocystis_antarctica.AAC.2